MTLEGVTFDFWNTLMWERPGDLVAGRVAAWSEILAAAGVAQEHAALVAAHQVAFDEYQRAWRSNRSYQVPDAAASMVATLGLDLASVPHERLIDAFSDAGLTTDLELADGIEGCLDDLRKAGLRIGIVCDVGLTPSPVLLRHLDRRGLLHHFDSVTFSDEVGVYKPDPAIFRHALHGLGIATPAHVAHVGDRRRTDVAGALGAGMVAVRYAGVFDDDVDLTPEADIVITDHAQLARSLGLVW